MVKNSKNYKNFHLDNFNVAIGIKENRIILVVIVILVIILVFRKIFGSILERIIVFTIIFLLFLIISKNLIVTIISSCIIFLLINLMMKYRDTVENFEDLKDVVDNKEAIFDVNVFDTDDMKNASNNIKNFVKKMNGGIELKDDDTKETSPLNKDLSKYKSDNNMNPLKKAQLETFQLIDTVNALKDTITTLAPVLSEGKKLMDVFQSMKI